MDHFFTSSQSSNSGIPVEDPNHLPCPPPQGPLPASASNGFISSQNGSFGTQSHLPQPGDLGAVSGIQQHWQQQPVVAKSWTHSPYSQHHPMGDVSGIQQNGQHQPMIAPSGTHTQYLQRQPNRTLEWGHLEHLQTPLVQINNSILARSQYADITPQVQRYVESLPAPAVESRPSRAVEVERLQARVAKLEEENARLKRAADKQLLTTKELEDQKAQTKLWAKKAAFLQERLNEMAPPPKSPEAIKPVGGVSPNNAGFESPPESTANPQADETWSNPIDLTTDDHSEPAPNVGSSSVSPVSLSRGSSSHGQAPDADLPLANRMAKRKLEWLEGTHPITGVKRQRVLGPDGEYLGVEEVGASWQMPGPSTALSADKARELKNKKARDRRSQLKAAAQAQKEKVERDGQEKVEQEEQEKMEREQQEKMEREQQERVRVMKAKRNEKSKKDARARDKRMAQEKEKEKAELMARWAREAELEEVKKRELEAIRIPQERASSSPSDASMDRELFGSDCDEELPAAEGEVEGNGEGKNGCSNDDGDWDGFEEDLEVAWAAQVKE